MIAWIAASRDEVSSPELAACLDAVRGPSGDVGNVMRVHSLRPHTMMGHQALYMSVLHHDANQLPMWFQEVIASWVSILNRCDYSLANHFANARHLLGDDDRADAIRRMRYALDAYYIRGVHSNIPFLSAVFSHPRFAAGRLSTNFIDEEYPNGFGADDLRIEEPSAFVSVAAAVQRRYRARETRISDQVPGYEPASSDDWVVVMNGHAYRCRATSVEIGEEVEFDGRTYVVRSDWWFGQPLFKGTINGEPVCFQIERRGLAYQFFHRGVQADVRVLTPRQEELRALMHEQAAPDLSRFLLSPMPGLLVSLAVGEGDRVKAGEALAVVEAMKMENVLRAENDVTVKAVLAAPGDHLAVDQPILEFE